MGSECEIDPKRKENRTNLEIQTGDLLGVNPVNHQLNSLVHMTVGGPFLIKS